MNNILDDDDHPDWNECEFCGAHMLVYKPLCQVCVMKKKKGCLIGADEYNSWDVYVLNNATKRVIATKRLSYGKGVSCVGPGMGCRLVFKKVLFGGKVETFEYEHSLPYLSFEEITDLIMKYRV